jgi:hypothetical protein
MAELSCCVSRTIIRKSRRKRPRHVHIPSVVRSIRNLLAAGDFRARHISVCVATAAALPNPRRRGPRSARSRVSGDHAAVSIIGRAVQDMIAGAV